MSGSDDLNLPGGFVLRKDAYRDVFILECPLANIGYQLADPRGYQSVDVWAHYVERTANAKPGSLQPAIIGAINGKHWPAATQVYGSPASGSGQSTGGSALSSPEAFRRTKFAIDTGQISASEAHAYYNFLMSEAMAHHAFAAPAYLGAGYSQQMSAVQAAQAYMPSGVTHYPGGLTYSGGPMSNGGPPHQATCLKSEGLRAGEIIAWRAWLVVGEQLMSVVADGKLWSETEPMAGDPAAGYGVHAYKAPHGPLLDSYVQKGSANHWVIGEVALWGDVIEHEDGYRAEFARVHSLVTWHEFVSPKTRANIAAKYLSAPTYKIEDAA